MVNQMRYRDVITPIVMIAFANISLLAIIVAITKVPKNEVSATESTRPTIQRKQYSNVLLETGIDQRDNNGLYQCRP